MCVRERACVCINVWVYVMEGEIESGGINNHHHDRSQNTQSKIFKCAHVRTSKSSGSSNSTILAASFFRLSPLVNKWTCLLQLR